MQLLNDKHQTQDQITRLSFPHSSALWCRGGGDLPTSIDLDDGGSSNGVVITRLGGVVDQGDICLTLDTSGDHIDDEVITDGLDRDDDRGETREEGGESVLSLGGLVLHGGTLEDDGAASALVVGVGALQS